MADSGTPQLTDNEKLEEMCTFFDLDPRLHTPSTLLVRIVYILFKALRVSELI